MYSVFEEDKYLYKENVSLFLADNWWNTSYSYDYYAKNDDTVNILPIRKKHSNDNLFDEIDEYKFSKSIEKEIMKGDFHFQETNYKDKDYAHHQKVKLRFIKYSIYPAVLFSLFFTFAILSMLVKL